MLLFPAGLFRAIREREEGSRDAKSWSDKSHGRPSNVVTPLGPQRRKYRSACATSLVEGGSACARRIDALVSKWADQDLSELRDKPAADVKAPEVAAAEQALDTPGSSLAVQPAAPAHSLDMPQQGMRRAKTLYSLPPLHAIFNGGQNGALDKASVVSYLRIKRSAAVKGECDDDQGGLSKPKKKLAVQINFSSHCHNVSREVVSIASNLLSWRSVSSGRPDVWWLDGNSSANFALFGTLLDSSVTPSSPSAGSAAMPRQRINFFPGMCNLCHKRTLALLLERMKAFYPNEFAFSPRTYMLPEQLSEIKEELAKGTCRANCVLETFESAVVSMWTARVRAFESVQCVLQTGTTKTFILKPDNRSLGKGIKLVRHAHPQLRTSVGRSTGRVP